MHDEARRLLRLARERAGFSQEALAQRARCSVSTIRAYETTNAGRQRNPTRDQLEPILRALYVPRDEETSILDGFGFSTSRTLFPAERFPTFYFEVDELAAEVARVPWPEFVVNTSVDILAANKPAERLWGVTLVEQRQRARSGTANLLSVATQPEIASRIVNWDECVSVVIGTLKGTPERPESLEQPSRRFEDVLADLIDGDPRFVARIAELWATTAPLSAKIRWEYPIIWQDPAVGEMRFRALVSSASEPAGLGFNDWHPIDADTWERMERLTRSRTDSGW